VPSVRQVPSVDVFSKGQVGVAIDSDQVIIIAHYQLALKERRRRKMRGRCGEGDEEKLVQQQ
jgi:hypothetical protein